jgi:hypothetical protein
MIVMTAAALAIPESGVSRNRDTLTLPVNGWVKNGRPGIGRRRVLGRFA